VKIQHWPLRGDLAEGLEEAVEHLLGRARRYEGGEGEVLFLGLLATTTTTMNSVEMAKRPSASPSMI
jgi:hypothetical protein